MRLPNKFGTCYKLSGHRRKPWIARITTGWTTVVAQKGKNKGKKVPKQLYRTIGYYETRQEGMDALTLYRHNPVSPKAGMTLQEVYKEWSKIKYREGKKRKGISKSTENNYRAAWKYIGRFEKELFKELRTGHWQDVIDKCEEAGKSDSTIKKIKTLAVMLCNYAVQNDIIDKNYAEFVELPKTDKTEKERFSDLEVKKIETAAKENEWVNTVLILVYTGMRISEMIGLTKFNIDLEKKLITGGIKTDAGKNRIIPIHSKILEYIKYWYNKNGDRLICEGEEGKRILVKRYREKFYYPALKTAKVRKLTPHKCRHTFCSMLADARANPLAIQLMAGHADYGFTANEYTHPEIKLLWAAINKI